MAERTVCAGADWRARWAAERRLARRAVARAAAAREREADRSRWPANAGKSCEGLDLGGRLAARVARQSAGAVNRRWPAARAARRVRTAGERFGAYQILG